MNYRIEAIKVLLNKECLLERYFSLIQFKDIIVENLTKNAIFTKKECLLLSDDDLIKMGLPDIESVRLFRLFLCMYDVKHAKLKEIDKVSKNEEEKEIFKQLYLLPGVKEKRARLYALSGYTDLYKIAQTDSQKIIDDTLDTIEKGCLDIKAPLLKEVKTHIAVAKMLTEYRTES